LRRHVALDVVHQFLAAEAPAGGRFHKLVLVGAAHHRHQTVLRLADHEIIRHRARRIAVDLDDDVGDVVLALRPLAFHRHDTANERLDLGRAARRAIVGGPFAVRREARRDIGEAARIERHRIGRHQFADRILGFEHSGHAGLT
jgi:hypothetical protein